MLSISRHVGESIIIGDQILSTVLSVKGKRVRLAIDAPSEISIRRQELKSKGAAQFLKADHVSASKDGFAEIGSTERRVQEAEDRQ